MSKKKGEMSTRTLHVGEKVNPTSAHVMPVFGTSSYCFSTWAKAREAFEKGDSIYTRLNSPNFRHVEAKIADLEGVESALVFSSGMAAIDTTIRALFKPGDHIVCSRTLYGCTHELFFEEEMYGKFGLEFSAVDTRDSEKVIRAIRANTKGIFLEILSNPTLEIPDVNSIARIAKDLKIWTLMDSTFITPYNFRPREWGIDVIIHSLTKYLNGLGTIVMGAVAADQDVIDDIAVWRCNAGPIPSPRDCAELANGLKTFTCRMPKHNHNAFYLASFLEDHEAVEKVIYPGLKSHPQYELARGLFLRKEHCTGGFGGMISFELAGPIEKTEYFLNALAKEEIVSFAVSLGCVDTLIQHPASMTHAGVPKEERLKRGITDKLLRLSVGTEDYSDLEEVFKRNLDKLIE